MRVGSNPSDVREIELKLEVELGNVERLKAHPPFHSADAEVRKLENVYFDTCAAPERNYLTGAA